MLPISLISNYLKGVQLTKENQRQGGIKNGSSTGAIITGKRIYLLWSKFLFAHRDPDWPMVVHFVNIRVRIKIRKRKHCKCLKGTPFAGTEVVALEI